MSSDRSERGDLEQSREWSESVVTIRRCAAVVKGGRRFSFNALVVVGNGKGQVAWGYGKANEVPPAVEKGVKDAHKQMVRVNLKKGTFPQLDITFAAKNRQIKAPFGQNADLDEFGFPKKLAVIIEYNGHSYSTVLPISYFYQGDKTTAKAGVTVFK